MKKFLGSCFLFFFPELNTGCIFSGIQSKVTVWFQCSYVQYHKQKWVLCPWALLHYFTHFNVVVGTDLYSWKTSFLKNVYDGLSIDGSFQHRRLCVILVHFNSMAWGFKKKKKRSSSKRLIWTAAGFIDELILIMQTLTFDLCAAAGVCLGER